MALAAPYTGEVELDAVADRFEPLANIGDPESVFLGLLSAVIEGVFQAQTSAVARNRLAERLVDADGIAVCPNISALLTFLGSNAAHLRREIRLITNAPTDAELAATDGEVAAQQYTLLGPIH